MSRFISFSTYSDWWKKQRSHFKHALSGAVVRTDYSPLIEAKAQEYVARCAARPETALSEANRYLHGDFPLQYALVLTPDDLGQDCSRDNHQIDLRETRRQAGQGLY